MLYLKIHFLVSEIPEQHQSPRHLYPNLSEQYPTPSLSSIFNPTPSPQRPAPKKPISKNAISKPYNFKHVYHIGFNSQTNNFESTKNVLENENLHKYLKQFGGFSDEDLKDRQAIYDYLDKNGGIDKAIEFELAGKNFGGGKNY